MLTVCRHISNLLSHSYLAINESLAMSTSFNQQFDRREHTLTDRSLDSSMTPQSCTLIFFSPFSLISKPLNTACEKPQKALARRSSRGRLRRQLSRRPGKTCRRRHDGERNRRENGRQYSLEYEYVCNVRRISCATVYLERICGTIHALNRSLLAQHNSCSKVARSRRSC